MSETVTVGQQGRRLIASYKRYDTRRTRIEKEIERLESEYAQQVAALRAVKDESVRHLTEQKKKLVCPKWVDVLIRPFVQEVARRRDWQFDISGPFGLGCNVPVFFYAGDGRKNEDVVGYLKFTAGSVFQDGKVWLRDYLTDTGLCKQGSIGWMNELNHPTIDIPSDATADWFEQQVEEFNRREQPVAG